MTPAQRDIAAAVWRLIRPAAVWYAHDAAARAVVVVAEHVLGGNR